MIAKIFRFVFSITLILPFSPIISAQNLPCGTAFSDDDQEKIKKTIFEARNYRSKSGTIYNVPIQFHIVGDDNGSGYFELTDILVALCELNVKFEPVGFHFYMMNDPNYINNTNFSEGNSGTTMMSIYNVDNSTNVYFIPNQPGLCGYFSWAGDGVVIANGCGNSGNTTITHELGHYFSLPHTFSGWEGYDALGTAYPGNVEYVDGSNCSSGGDYFCDTPADFLNMRWTCPYSYDTYKKVDPKGDPYDVDGSLYMSYANDECGTRFSDEQIVTMQYNLVMDRSDLLQNSDPDDFAISNPKLQYPADEQINVPKNFFMIYLSNIVILTLLLID